MVMIVGRSTQFTLVANVPNKSVDAVIAATIISFIYHKRRLLQRMMARNSRTTNSGVLNWEFRFTLRGRIILGRKA
jgi:hypothetical protein